MALALIRPFLTMIVFTVVFGNLAKLPSEGAPYPILVFAAMLPWQFFANALAECSNSLLANANMISKVYFPRLIVPASAVIVSFVDFMISGMILLALMAWYNFVPSWRILTLPIFIAIAFAASIGAGLWLSALNVEYRDFRYIVPFIVQFGLFISPVGFGSELVPERWRLLYACNPMVGMSDVVIRAEGVGKKYLIRRQHERQRYVALRDVVADKLLMPWRRLQGRSA